MKSITNTLRLTLIALICSVSSLHAQWDTIKNFNISPMYQSIKDISFKGSIGYGVGKQSSPSTYTGFVGLISKTTDGGITWNNILLPQSIGNDTISELRSVSITSSTTAFATAVCFSFTGGYYGSLLKTIDGGMTWQVNLSTKSQINTTTFNAMFFNSVEFISPNQGFISASFQYFGISAGQGYVYTTTNGGNTWSNSISSTATPTSAQHFTSSSIGIAVGGVSNNDVGNSNQGLLQSFAGEISRSTNGGSTWTSILTDPMYGFSDVYFPSSQIGYVIGDSIEPYYPTSGNVMKTTNGGLTWSVIHTFPHFQPRCVYFINDTIGYIGGRTNFYIGSGLYKTIDGGITWTPETHPNNTSGKILAITFSTPVTGYAVNDTVDYVNNTASSIYGNFPTASCSVFLGPDTSFCQTQGQLFATPGTPSSDYVFSWSPSTGLSDSTAQNPFVNHVSNQQYVVTMTNTVTLCSATDTIVVSAYNMLNSPVYKCPGDSVLLDFGPGATNYFWQFYTDTNNVTSFLNSNTQTYWATDPGAYAGYATFTGCGALTSVVNVIDSCFISPCSVNAGPDVVFCQIHGQLHATPGAPGNYTFTWSPAFGLDNPNSQNPNVIAGVDSMLYVVTMTDTAANCTSTDTVMVSAYYWSIDTAYSCNNQPVTFDLGPGGFNYTVQYTDTLGNFHFVTLPNQYLVATQPGQYVCIAYFNSCGALTSLLTVIDSCNVAVGNVWPGDCDYNLIANNADALQIGLAYGATGATRPNASNAWYAQPMSDWTQNYINCNYKHGDADGNGTIDVNDTLPIYQNYGNTHPFRLQPVVAPASAPALNLVANYDTVGLQTLVTVDIRLGTLAVPIDSLYGISFRITADAGLIDTTMTLINLSNTWLGTNGTNLFGFRKYFRSAGAVDAAESRNDLTNRLGGNGSIGSFLIVTTDNLSGIAVCHFNVTDITAVTISQHYITMGAVNDSVVIDSNHPAGVHELSVTPSFSIYPNPANESVTVQTNSLATEIEICDMLGRTISSTVPNSNATIINTATLADGVYLLRVKNGKTISTQKLSVTH